MSYSDTDIPGRFGDESSEETGPRSGGDGRSGSDLAAGRPPQNPLDVDGFTIGELAARAGVTSRTIHYYVSQGLLPGPGKQGPRTRYPQSFLDLLLRIRQLQTEGNHSLRTIRAAFEAEGLAPRRARKRRAGSRRSAPSRDEGHSSDGSPRSTDRVHAEHRVADEPGDESSSLETVPFGPTAADLLSGLQDFVGDRRVPSSGSGDRWVTVPISKDLVLAGRRLRKSDLEALQRAADYLRFILVQRNRPS